MLIGFLDFVWLMTSIFMMLVILIQRGRGGGLAGAFGAVGGSSAFGTRAGDTMTKVTVGVFLFWLLQAGILVNLKGTSRLAGEIEKLGGGSDAVSKALEESGGSPILPPESTTDASKSNKAASKPAATEPEKADGEKAPKNSPAESPKEKSDAPASPKAAEKPAPAEPKAGTPAGDAKPKPAPETKTADAPAKKSDAPDQPKSP